MKTKSLPALAILAGAALSLLAGGILFGLLREFSRSVFPPLLAHAAFDFVTYGNLAHPPWWVWS